MDSCLEADQKLGMRLSRQGWEQPVLYTLGIRAGYAEAEGERDKATEESEVERETDGRVRADDGEGIIW